MSRTNKTALNSAVGLTASFVNNVLAFVLKGVFIRLLGLEYAGVNGLFACILNILNLAELGFSNAIMFRLYKVIANNDREGVETYLAVYKKICFTVAAVECFLSVCCIPFLDFFIKEKPQFPESLWSLYAIVLTSSVLGQALSYKGILILAKQDNYISTIIGSSCNFLCLCLQMVVLCVYKNIYLYLLVNLFITILRPSISEFVSKRKYGATWKSNKNLSREERKDIVKDVGCLSAYKICGTIEASMDTFLISKYIAVATTAIYGGVSSVLAALYALFSVFNSGMSASIGDLYASDNKKHSVRSVFYQAFHFTYLLHGISSAVLVPLLSDFVHWWIGFTLSDACVYVMIINYYMFGLGMSVATFRNSMGLFQKGWKRPLATALANLFFSLLLINRIGLIGTLLGTLIGRSITWIWYDPYIVCKYGLNEKPWKYYRRYVFYGVVVVLTCIITLLLKSVLPPIDSFPIIVLHGTVYLSAAIIIVLGVCVIIPEQRLLLERVLTVVRTLENRVCK